MRLLPCSSYMQLGETFKAEEGIIQPPSLHRPELKQHPEHIHLFSLLLSLSLPHTFYFLFAFCVLAYEDGKGCLHILVDTTNPPDGLKAFIPSPCNLGSIMCRLLSFICRVGCGREDGVTVTADNSIATSSAGCCRLSKVLDEVRLCCTTKRYLSVFFQRIARQSGGLGGWVCVKGPGLIPSF